ncbi:MAG: hypothetical protein KY476_05470 [Planctomycetes bacterium]|nr:hypothetical protein [Planctomycetota bacterium]
MPAVADLPPQHSVVIVRSFPEAQGCEGRFLSDAAERATSHWEDRAERLLSRLNGADDETLDYESVPLVPVGSVLVRYEIAGELRPLPYEWDE